MKFSLKRINTSISADKVEQNVRQVRDTNGSEFIPTISIKENEQTFLLCSIKWSFNWTQKNYWKTSNESFWHVVRLSIFHRNSGEMISCGWSLYSGSWLNTVQFDTELDQTKRFHFLTDFVKNWSNLSLRKWKWRRQNKNIFKKTSKKWRVRVPDSRQLTLLWRNTSTVVALSQCGAPERIWQSLGKRFHVISSFDLKKLVWSIQPLFFNLLKCSKAITKMVWTLINA